METAKFIGEAIEYLCYFSVLDKDNFRRIVDPFVHVGKYSIKNSIESLSIKPEPRKSFGKRGKGFGKCRSKFMML